MSDTMKMDELRDNGLVVSESNIELKLRKLNTGDIFNAARMIKRLEIKEELKSLIGRFSTKTDQEKEGIPDESADEKGKLEVGVDFIFSLMEILTNESAENEFYRFLANPLGVSEQQVKELEIEILAEAVMKIADIERWKHFLSQAVR